MLEDDSPHLVYFLRIPEPASRSANLPSDIELMLQDYHQAREEAKVEIAQARDRLRERTEQEKQRIRQQIISQLLKVRNEVIFCLKRSLKPGPDLRLWQPVVEIHLEGVGLCFQPKAGLIFPLQAHQTTFVTGQNVEGKGFCVESGMWGSRRVVVSGK